MVADFFMRAGALAPSGLKLSSIHHIRCAALTAGIAVAAGGQHQIMAGNSVGNSVYNADISLQDWQPVAVLAEDAFVLWNTCNGSSPSITPTHYDLNAAGKVIEKAFQGPAKECQCC